MIRRRLHTILCLLGLLALAAPAAAQQALDPAKLLTQYRMDVWTGDDGLPQHSVMALEQTRDGYLWLGTQEGLVRFDGLRMQIFDKRSGELQNNFVSALLEDRHGALWIGTRGGGLTRMQGGEATTFTTAEGLAGNEISSLAEGPGGVLWIGAHDGGLTRLADGVFQPIALPSEAITALHATADGALWIGTRGQGLLHRSPAGTLTAYTTADGLPDDDVSSLAQAPGGVLWIGTRQHGLARFADGVFTPYTTADGLAGDRIWTLTVDPAGSLWVGTDGGGLCRFYDGHFACLGAAQGLAHDVVKALYSDREGILWVGTDGGGLNSLRDGKFVLYTTAEGLPSNFAWTIYEDAAGVLWVGTEDQGLARLDEGRFTTFTTADGLAGNEVTALAGTPDGAIWAGTYGSGLSRFHKGRFTTFTTADGLPSNYVYALFTDSGGTLWVATGTGLLAFRDGTFVPQPLPTDDPTAIAEGPDGALWVGSYTGGLNRLVDGEVVATYSTANGLGTDYVLDIYPDAEGTVWFTMREGGLGRLRNGALTVYTTRDGLYNDTITRLLEDEEGRLWMASGTGLTMITKVALDQHASNPETRLNPVIFDASDGLKRHEFMGGTQPAGWKAADGRLWFPTTGGGIAGIAPSHISRNNQPPRIVLESVSADGALPIGPEVAELAPGHDEITFQYAGLSLRAPDKVQYRVMLEGMEEDWKDYGTRREAFYPNLAPGAYTFRVIARNDEGVWSEPATFSFYLRPYFYQRPLFYVFCALLLILGALTAYRLRVRHLKHRQRELEEQVEARTADLREEKERTEEALRQTEEARREAEHRKEQVQQAKSVIEEQAERLQEMDRIKTRFFNNISHEFRTPLTLNIGPLENALMGVYGPLSDSLRRQLEIMLRNARLLLRLINQLLDVSKLESGQLQLKPRQADLVQLVEGIVVSFTAFAERKQLALTFESEPAHLPMLFDPGQLEKVFFNLLSNAIKFTPEEGAIRVEIGAVAAGAEGEAVQIRVSDTGPGIPANELPYVFDRFHQVDGAVSKVQEGTGIGLSLVKELVDLHEGTIEVESAVGEGTTFVVTLPYRSDGTPPAFDLEDDAPATPVSHGALVELVVFDDPDLTLREGAPADADAPLVLVTDDNPEIRDYVASCLRNDYRITTALDGQDAYEKARAERPALIVSDVQMPRMTGYELCQAVRADAAISHTPVILLTSRASLDEKIQGLDAGADDYLTKPFSARELLARVRNLLALASQKRTLQTLNSELRQTNADLREVSEMKSQLLRIAAHDLKNPLNGIREFAKILKTELASTQPHSLELLDLIHASSDQMLSMVGKILDSEALESGELVMDRAPVSAVEIAREVVRVNRPQAERKGETLVLTAEDGDPCTVLGAREWLRDAMDNLVSNAIKYSPFDKNIWVTVRRHEGRVRFSVRDQGPGLTDEDKQMLFGKFQRLSATPTSDESSTGLGLSIVKQIVELHGGRVWAESEPGQGATFIIELDAAGSGTPAALARTRARRLPGEAAA